MEREARIRIPFRIFHDQGPNCPPAPPAGLICRRLSRVDRVYAGEEEGCNYGRQNQVHLEGKRVSQGM